MATMEKVPVGKNPLWLKYKMANPIVRAEVILELKKRNVYRHWQTVACKEGYDLERKANAQLRDIFIKLMPETAPLFGVTIDQALHH
ncbi:hypothetical protein G8759_19835 [Spirosoma aureum]|uniref:Uncharacterized protein n=1 Tax=Spirosoma aureum TaxID=2692134 RepID=A0A6G9AQD4_9BACT|nr:hypothetical protein [Spirosoma aureum]QIP14702.1 hypothetical protein G8759_19835 [Spirosoma aureum]